MALYAIGDLHLSLGVNKPMDVFGGRWHNYMQKLEEGFAHLTAEDSLVLCGDTSWGMTLPQSLRDFAYLASLPCKQIYMVKGNHDYWWQTAAKMTGFWRENGFTNLALLHNNAHPCDKYVLCGTRGWFYEEEQNDHNEKVFNRELLRLTASLEAAQAYPDNEILCFLHYPPFVEGYVCEQIVAILQQYNVKRCFYGHLHGASCARAIEGVHNGIDYTLLSADHLHFQPLKIE